MSCWECMICLFIFFFKQKTAYEMRISDWSSDVCSSDLTVIFQTVVDPTKIGVMERARHADGIHVPRDVVERHFAIVLGSAAGRAGFCRRGDRRSGREGCKRIGDHRFSSHRSEEHTSELQSLMRNSYAVLCWKKKK